MPEQTTSPEDLARHFHETYERLAPDYGYKTREASAVPWPSVPEANRSLMIAVAGEVLGWLASLADELAKIAYAAYGESTGGKNFQGNPMPTWEELPEPIRRAWVAAAGAVADKALADDSGGAPWGTV